MAKLDLRLLSIIAIVLIVLSMQNTLPKDAVADVEGQACTVDEDCPCWGEYIESGVTAYGLGVSSCKDNLCDTTFCVDVEPVGIWLRDHPWQWVRDNPLIVMALIVLIMMSFTLPKK